ncbi:MAG: ATP-binding cassette domain-containing protein [Planctomycetes bacterium]|nr:ATP-binding cassette domain-containing protein [Planctomycetota bacterium]
MSYSVSGIIGVHPFERGWPTIVFQPGAFEVLATGSNTTNDQLYYACLGLLGIRQTIQEAGRPVTKADLVTPRLPPGVAVVDTRSAPHPERSVREEIEAVSSDPRMVNAALRGMDIERWASTPVADLRRRWAEELGGSAERRLRDPDFQEAVEDRWTDSVKRIEIARAFASGMPWIFLLDSPGVAGQAQLLALLAPIWRLWKEVGTIGGLSPGVVLMTPFFSGGIGGPPVTARHIEFDARTGTPVLVPGRLERSAARDERKLLIDEPALSYRYPDLDRRRDWDLWKIDLALREGDVLVVLGESGGGKSTLLKLLMGLEKSTPPTRFRQAGARKAEDIGLVFQKGALFTSLSVIENVAYPLVEMRGLSWESALQIAGQHLKSVHLTALDETKMPADLSGGQTKRVAIARALALGSKVLLYDEPSAGLDPPISRELGDLILEKGKDPDHPRGSLVVTHELESAFAIADRMIFLAPGERERDEEKNLPPFPGRRYWSGSQIAARGTREEIRGTTHPAFLPFLGEQARFAHDPLVKAAWWY